MTSMSDELPAPTNPLASIPPLTTRVLVSEPDKVAALKLVADSIAQQRQAASRAAIFHPLTIAVYIGLLAIVSQLLYKTREDIGIVATTGAGVTMACLILVRGLTSGYINLAEELNWNFLTVNNNDGEEDVVIGSRYGEEIIGALVLRLERNGNGSGKKGRKLGGKGVVRAWTVRIKYRGKGVGTELLEEAVRVTRERMGGSAEVGFAAEHANSQMVLPELFNGGFRKREAKAAKTLDGVVGSFEGKKKR
ncbi:hypothetical protein LHYA1_G006564 [Lachnellula hyalina]|uniref:N-acetyltransferase domain-containing protein n=1 Tax=Lachnellula hyalina TaxID=1316788 RepID=A0A8H8TWV3_9HELO|nr:uncharacterized protein LHYA1_G006564 [Lachnellula hyalina]TVY23665.1 hypothetical protein LHYA1_G006564 [Lachnellula hyalina]